MFASLVACRAAHDASAAFLFGASGFLAALVPPRLRRAMAGDLRTSVAAAVAVLVVSGLAWPALQAAELGAGWRDALDPGAIGSVLFDTGFGRAWQVHLLSVAALAALTISGRERPGDTALAAGLALASLGLVGHAAMHAGPIGWLHRGNDALHLLAGGAWVGSLPPLVRVMRRLDDAESRADAVTSLRRFSAAGHVAVVLVASTGIVNTALVLGTLPTGATPYQILLLCKGGLVAVMVLLATVNRYRLVPKASRSDDALPRLRRNTIAAAVLGGAVLLVTAALGLVDPE